MQCLGMSVGGEGREKKLADIDRCEQQAAQFVQQATAVPLGLVRLIEARKHPPLPPCPCCNMSLVARCVALTVLLLRPKTNQRQTALAGEEQHCHCQLERVVTYVCCLTMHVLPC